MTRKLTAAGEAVLDSKTVPIKFSVKIAGVANPDVINYDYRFDRNFGASSLGTGRRSLYCRRPRRFQ